MSSKYIDEGHTIRKWQSWNGIYSRVYLIQLLYIRLLCSPSKNNIVYPIYVKLHMCVCLHTHT